MSCSNNYLFWFDPLYRWIRGELTGYDIKRRRVSMDKANEGVRETYVAARIE